MVPGRCKRETRNQYTHDPTTQNTELPPLPTRSTSKYHITIRVLSILSHKSKTSFRLGNKEQSLSSVDLSSFEQRWIAALGPPRSNRAKDFRLYGGIITDIVMLGNEEVRLLRDEQYIESSNGLRFLNLPDGKKFLHLESK